MQDRVPLYPGRVKLTPVSGKENTYDMVRADEPTQEGTPLNKSTFLKDTTAALYGLGADAVPDDVFAWLGKFNQHRWKRVDQSPKQIYKLVKTESSIDAVYFYSSGDIYRADDVSINEQTGELSLVNPVIADLTAFNQPYYYQSANAIRFDGTVITSIIKSNGYYQGIDGRPEYFGFATGGYDQYMPYILSSELVTVPNGDVDFVYSTDRDAYPDSGIHDGYEYEYLGVPFDKLNTASLIKTGSYVGTGTYGESSPNSLTFDFAPKIIFIVNSLSFSAATIFIRPSDHSARDNNNSSSGYELNLKWLANGVSWYKDTYDSNDPTNQLNVSGRIYYYIAIG